MNDICGYAMRPEFGAPSGEAFGDDVGWPRAAWRDGENSHWKNRRARENAHGDSSEVSIVFWLKSVKNKV
jgi:hypothetical protein